MFLLLRCSLRASRPVLIFFVVPVSLSLLPVLSYLCLYPCSFPSLFFVTTHVCLSSFVFLLSSSCPFSFVFLPTTFLPSAALPSPVSPSSFRCGVVTGAVSSGQSYPSAQYESGLQQRGQQGEQPGHQPCTLLHAPW